MGMIMKDGVPYGGVYPIDDVPTQGSSNTVKSGGVFSSLSNKVDKVEGKGLSTNDYDDTEKGKVADNAEAIEAISGNISDAYIPSRTYNVGNYCIHENALYKCNTANTTGDWDSSKWNTVTVADELGELTDFAMSFKPTGLSFECIGTLIGTSISDVFQDIVNMYYTGTLTDIKYFVGLHSYAGVRMVIGYIYPDKRYGACLAFSFASQAQIQFLNDGIYSTQNL